MISDWYRRLLLFFWLAVINDFRLVQEVGFFGGVGGWSGGLAVVIYDFRLV